MTVTIKKPRRFPILPYSRIVGQSQLKLALELAFIDPDIRGVLLSGERGTAKSTAVRAFSQMMYGKLPTTLPINATEDRVVGGWRIDALMSQKDEWQPGLLQEADGKLLYVDEINLLDDHLVNIILDVASTDVLVVQREGKSIETPVHFTLVGTMNPEEGGLRPQLLDRFGLMVAVPSEESEERRLEILETMLCFDREAQDLARAREDLARAREVLERDSKAPTNQGPGKADMYHRQRLLHTLRTGFKARARESEATAAQEPDEGDTHRKQVLLRARELVKDGQVDLSREALVHCVKISRAFAAEGHRGEHVMALAARAFVARELAEIEHGPAPELPRPYQVRVEDVLPVARLAIQHRRHDELRGEPLRWRKEDDELLQNPDRKPAPQGK
ncbi:AAA family ATPase [Archangium sp. Cb G35]|uniref:AAA family ATPase n=1 Tax=Archangium sp. Cb G35 TaxID=1920190 RepID=UPI000B004425|nr:AAA family ATPase [Archangium sp. Cb G35]